MKTLPAWREQYNPLRGLTMQRIVAMEGAADRGQHADLQWFYHHMERADVTVQSAIARRVAFLDTLDWEIRADPEADPALAAEQQAALREAYNRIENLKDATRALAFAIFRGFALAEKLPAPEAPHLVARLDPVDQWYWIQPHAGPWQLNPETKPELAKGEEVERARLCVNEVPAANRAIARHFFSKVLALADWDTALETSANPSIFIFGPPGAGPEQEAEYRAVAERIASNGRGYLPNGADVKCFDPAQRGRMPFMERIDYCDRQIVMAATGGLLTMLAQSGSGTLAGGAHSESLMTLARSDAARLAETYQRDLDAPWLEAWFPGQPKAAWFEFTVPQTENTAQLLDAAANLNWAGYRVDQEQLQQKTGLKLIPIQTEPPA